VSLFKRRYSAQERYYWAKAQHEANRARPASSHYYTPERPAPGDWDRED
jgi:hypothetical protein